MKKFLPGVGLFNLGGKVDDNWKDAGRSVSTNFFQPITS
jgi:hypothetical protein